MGLSLRRSKSPCIMMYLLLRCAVLLTVTLLVQAAPRWHTNDMTIINGQTYINGKLMDEVKPCPECAECAGVSCGGNSIIQRNGVLCCRPENDHPFIKCHIFKIGTNMTIKTTTIQITAITTKIQQ